ncbi:MAG: substrate-binding domain-containing protein [Planctomycetaceae bacterium]
MAVLLMASGNVFAVGDPVAPVISIRHLSLHRSAVESMIAGFEGDRRLRSEIVPSGMVREGVEQGECQFGLDWEYTQARPKASSALLEEHRIGTYAVAIVASRNSDAQFITKDEVGAVFQGRIRHWAKLAGSDRVSRIQVYGTTVGSPAAIIIKYDLFAPDLQMWHWDIDDFRKGHQKVFAREVFEAVAADRNAVGFVTFDPREELPKSVRLIPIAADEDSPAVFPSAETIYDRTYPLLGDIALYSQANPEDSIKAFIRYATGKEGAGALEAAGILTEYDRHEYLGKQRFLAAKRGEGAELRMVGPRAGINVMRELTAEYVKAEEVVQVPYVARSQILAVRDFSYRAADWKEGEPYRRGADIILLDDTIQRETRLAHGLSWLKSIHPAETWELGRIGVAVVAHKSNPVDWLSMEELRDIYTNRIRDWERLERGNNPAAAPLGAMKRYGLKAGQPVFLVFAEKTLGGRPMAQTIQRDTTEEVIASVALDPAAIGFVSLTDLKHDENRVKILGITPQDGLFPETIGPEGPTEKYPLQQRWTLYLGPYAYRTPETRRFAEFLTSNETAAEIMRKHGLIASSTITADPLKGVTTKSDMEKRRRAGCAGRCALGVFHRDPSRLMLHLSRGSAGRTGPFAGTAGPTGLLVFGPSRGSGLGDDTFVSRRAGGGGADRDRALCAGRPGERPA